MHNLHFLLVRADAATDAAAKAANLILHWGDENNGRCVGGIASEDGHDDIENYEDGRWGLSDLESYDAPMGETPFARAAAWIRREIAQPLKLSDSPDTQHPDAASALRALGNRIAAFDPLHDGEFALWQYAQALEQVRQVIVSRRALAAGAAVPEFRSWDLDQFGLTDLTEHSDGAQRYLVFLDMHS